MTSLLVKEVIMKKEDILDKARKENKKKDFAVIEIENKAVKIAALGMLLLTTVYYCLEIFIQGKKFPPLK